MAEMNVIRHLAVLPMNLKPENATGAAWNAAYCVPVCNRTATGDVLLPTSVDHDSAANSV